MNSNNYKKTYKGLYIWIILFALTVCIIPIILSEVITDGKLLTEIILFLVIAFLALLMLMIYKGEYVYWINGGPDYEKARKATSGQQTFYLE